MDSGALAALVDAQFDGGADDAGLAALQTSLRRDPELRRAYLREMRFHGQLRSLLSPRPAAARIRAPQRRWLRIVVLAAGAAGLAAIAVVSARRPTTGPPAIAIAPPMMTVAYVRGGSGAAGGLGISSGLPVAPGQRIVAPAGAAIGLAHPDGTRIDLNQAGSLTVAGDDRLLLHDGEAALRGRLRIDLSGAGFDLDGVAIVQSAPWAVLLRLDSGAVAGRPGLAPGGWSRRPSGGAWIDRADGPPLRLGNADVIPRYADRYRSTGRFVIQDAVAWGQDRWRPSGSELLARARDQGGDVAAARADGTAILADASGSAQAEIALPLGYAAGGVRLSFSYRFRADSDQGRCVVGVGASDGAPFPGAPATRRLRAFAIRDRAVHAAMEVRILPVGRLGGQELCEVGLWADGAPVLFGWVAGRGAVLACLHRSGSVRLADVAAAELWDTLPERE